MPRERPLVLGRISEKCKRHACFESRGGRFQLWSGGRRLRLCPHGLPHERWAGSSCQQKELQDFAWRLDDASISGLRPRCECPWPAWEWLHRCLCSASAQPQDVRYYESLGLRAETSQVRAQTTAVSGSPVCALACGYEHTVALTDAGAGILVYEQLVFPTASDVILMHTVRRSGQHVYFYIAEYPFHPLPAKLFVFAQTNDQPGDLAL